MYKSLSTCRKLNFLNLYVKRKHPSLIFTNSAATASNLFSRFWHRQFRRIFKFAVLPAVMQHFQRLALELDRRSNIWKETGFMSNQPPYSLPNLSNKENWNKKTYSSICQQFFRKEKNIFPIFCLETDCIFVFLNLWSEKSYDQRQPPPPTPTFFQNNFGLCSSKILKIRWCSVVLLVKYSPTLIY